MRSGVTRVPRCSAAGSLRRAWSSAFSSRPILRTNCHRKPGSLSGFRASWRPDRKAAAISVSSMREATENSLHCQVFEVPGDGAIPPGVRLPGRPRRQTPRSSCGGRKGSDGPRGGTLPVMEKAFDQTGTPMETGHLIHRRTTAPAAPADSPHRSRSLTVRDALRRADGRPQCLARRCRNPFPSRKNGTFPAHRRPGTPRAL